MIEGLSKIETAVTPSGLYPKRPYHLPLPKLMRNTEAIISFWWWQGTELEIGHEVLNATDQRQTTQTSLDLNACRREPRPESHAVLYGLPAT